MDWAIVLGLVVLLVLIVYLAIALIKPEYFS
ncbi:MAG: K(+)-transporting ATPase subunit F [Planctomycetota bacterium]